MGNRRLVILLVAVAFIAALFVAPVRSYIGSHERLAQAQADQRAVKQQLARLQARSKALDARAPLIREARAQGYVYPGETPFAVDGP